MFVMVLLRTAEQSEKWKGFMVFSLVAAIPFWAMITNVRFSGIAMIMTVIFYMLREKPRARLYTALAVGTVLKVTGGLSAVLIHKYSGQRGEYPKYLFYGLYPALWAVLAVVKMFTA